MEAFLLGDQGPDVFYEVQDSVVDVLQDKYYPLFISSENYSKMIAAMEEAALNNNDNNECNLNDLLSVYLSDQRKNFRRARLAITRFRYRIKSKQHRSGTSKLLQTKTHAA